MIGKKFALIYNKNTFIDLEFFSKLAWRYKFTAVLIPISLLGALSFLYLNQDMIYKKEVRFSAVKNVDEKKQASPVGGLSGLVGAEAPNASLNLSEIKNLTSSWEFYQKMAKKIINYPTFSTLKLKDNSGKVLPTNQMLKECNGQAACILEKISESVPKHFILKNNRESESVSIVVHGYEENFVNDFEMWIVTEIQGNRQEEVKQLLKEKVRGLDKIIADKSSAESNSENLKALGEESTIKEKINDYNEQIKDLQNILNEKQAELFQLDLRIDRLRKEKRVSLTDNDRINFEQKKKLESEIKDLRKNIQLLSADAYKFDETNKTIIKELRSELSIKESELKTIGSVNELVESKDDFAKKKNDSLPELLITSDVLKENVLKISSELSKLQEERADLIDYKNKLKEKIDVYKVNNREILDLRNERNGYQLRLLDVKSDLKFEAFNPYVEELDSHSLKKIVLLWIVLSFFLTVFYLMLRFFFDDKIYSEYELKSIFPGLKVINSEIDFDLSA